MGSIDTISDLGIGYLTKFQKNSNKISEKRVELFTKLCWQGPASISVICYRSLYRKCMKVFVLN